MIEGDKTILEKNLNWLKESGFFSKTQTQLVDLLNEEKSNKIYELILEELDIENTENAIKNLKFIMWNIKNINKDILKKIKTLIISWKSENMELFFGKDWIIQTKDDLEELIKNSKWDYIRVWISSIDIEKMKLIFGEDWIIKTKQELEDIINSSKWDDIRDLIEYWKFSPKPILNWLSYNNFDWDQELIKNELFNIMTIGSSVFDYLLDLMKTKCDKDMYELIDEDIAYKFPKHTAEIKRHPPEEIKNNFDKLKSLLGKNAEWEEYLIKELNINTKKLELAIYLRYWHIVDYPEIWEYIILFLNKYIEQWYSKYLSWIRVIPRHKNYFPRSWFFKWNEIKKYNIEWKKFKLTLKKFAIPFHLSHSIYEDTEDLPYIISWWMDQEGNPNEIDLWLELENRYDNIIKTNEKTIDEILKQVIKVMQELDKKLDEKVINQI